MNDYTLKAGWVRIAIDEGLVPETDARRRDYGRKQRWYDGADEKGHDVFGDLQATDY